VETEAFGRPGIAPTWTSSRKDLVTTALGPSRLWATLGYGILNEVYWPATGQPQLRDLGFIVAGQDFWVEVKRAAAYHLSTPEPYIPLPLVVHEGEGYRLTLEFLPDPLRDVLLISFRLAGEGLRLYPLLAPHLGMSGWNNTAWADDGLFAQRDGLALCLLADPPFKRTSAGYVGSSDGWQDFARHGRMTWTFPRADEGNVALIGEIEDEEGIMALGFGTSPAAARTLAASSLAEGYGSIREHFTSAWRAWGRHLQLPKVSDGLAREACLSATMLKVHEDRTFPGAMVASLSIPWGNTSNDPGGYHLVWPRDAVEAGFGLLAAGEIQDACRLLAYLAATQNADGGWCQNFFPGGRPHWTGVQLDEVGFPILLAAKLRELDVPTSPQTVRMVRQAVAHLVRHGPVSPQDRWEENPGASPFTLGVEVAALVVAAAYLEEPERGYVLELADCWNERIEEWTYVRNTPLSQQLGVEGYYVRIGPSVGEGGLRGRIEVRNTTAEVVPAEALIGMEFIYLARFGLRDAQDQRMQDSLKVIDAVLRVDTPCGPGYHRYNGDGYGEYDDGRPFDGRGVGRAWPLLTGERGHMAMLQGEDPLPYLEAMTCMTGPGGLIPEQVWDGGPIPERGLVAGKPTGSAMPLVWAHAEFLKLLMAREKGQPLERLELVQQRYRGKVPRAATWFWRSDVPFEELPAGRSLVIEDWEAFTLHFGFDGWQEVQDRPSEWLGFGMLGIRLTWAELDGHHAIDFTRLYAAGRWEGQDHQIAIQGAAADSGETEPPVKRLTRSRSRRRHR